MRLLVLVVLLALVCTRPAMAQQPTVFGTILEAARSEVVGRVVREIVERIWPTRTAEITEIRAELERLRRSIPLSTAQPVLCSDATANAFVTCILASIETAHRSGRVDDTQAIVLVQRLAVALGSPIAAPDGSRPPGFPALGFAAIASPATASPKLASPKLGSADIGAQRAAARQIGPNEFCIRDVGPNGTLRAGFIDGQGRNADWVEISRDRRTATLVSQRDRRQVQRTVVAGRTMRLRGRVKRDFARSVLFSAPATDQPRHAANLYFDSAGRPTIYFGTYRGQRRNGKGCYFGAIAVQPYCYRMDLRVWVSTNNRTMLSVCRS